MMYLSGETTAAMLTRFAAEAGRTLRGVAIDLRLPVNLFHKWATGRSLPSRLMVPSLAAAIGMDEAELAAHVAAERVAVRPAPTSARRIGNASAVADDVREAVAADAGLVRAYVGALADGRLDRAELVALRAKADAIHVASAALVRDLDAAIEAAGPAS
jgi:hypothetical protein